MPLFRTSPATSPT